MREMIENLKKKVNLHGELHLDAVQASLLIEFMTTIAKYQEDTDALLEKLSIVKMFHQEGK